MNEGVQILASNGQPFRGSAQDTAHYGASREARELRTWNPSLGSADRDMYGELETLVARQRDIVRNHGIANGAVQTLVDNVVGTGFRLAPKPNWRVLGWTLEQAREWSRNVSAQFKTWANSTECDASRQMNLASLTALTFRNGMMSGEGLALPLWLENRPGARWNTALQLVDTDRIATPMHKVADKTVRLGIETSRYGEPVAYYVAKHHPNDLPLQSLGAQDWERIPAYTSFGRRRVIHVHDKERTGQTRGKPIMSAVLPNFRMLSDYQRNEMKSAVTNSLVAAFVESPMGPEQLVDMFGGAAGDERKGVQRYMEDRGQWEAQLDGGAIIPLYPGDKMSAFNPGRPNAIYKEFIETVVREIGVSTGMPYELIMKDFSKTSYASVRASLMEAWRFFAGRRKWLTDYWLQPIYELWLEEAVNSGVIEAPGFYENRQAYSSAEWIGSGKGYVDPVREAQAAEDRMRIGISTLEKEAAEQGHDWEDLVEQRAYELDKMREMRIPLAAVGAARNAGDVPDPSAEEGQGNGQGGNGNENASEHIDWNGETLVGQEKQQAGGAQA